jgi:hypothetical protein
MGTPWFWIALIATFIVGGLVGRFAAIGAPQPLRAILRSGNAPGWATAATAIAALLVSSYFSYASNAEALDQFKLETAPILTLSCGITKTSPVDLSVELWPSTNEWPVGNASMPYALPAQWTSTYDHLLCEIRNYGRSPAINVHFDFKASYCDGTFPDAGSEVIPTVGSGDTVRILIANLDSLNEAAVQVSGQTTFVTPPTKELQSYTYPGWETAADAGSSMVLDPAPPLVLPGYDHPMPPGEDVCRSRHLRPPTPAEKAQVTILQPGQSKTLILRTPRPVEK